jgi:hypothetical protein
MTEAAFPIHHSPLPVFSMPAPMPASMSSISLAVFSILSMLYGFFSQCEMQVPSQRNSEATLRGCQRFYQKCKEQ